MATIMTMPAVLADSTEAELQSWMVSVGDTVTKGQAIAEIETEKATVELEAEAEGTLAKLTVEAGTSVEVGAPVAVIAAAGDTDEDVERALASVGVDGGTGQAGGAEGAADAPTTAGTKAPAAEGAGTDSVSTSTLSNGTDSASASGGRIFASPLARKIAERRGVDLGGIAGSGPNGRIIRADVERAVQAGTVEQSAPADAAPAAPAAEPTPNSATSAAVSSDGVADQGPFTDEPLTGMRKIIAQRLSESKATVPHFYVSMDAQIDDLLTLRRTVNEQLAGTGKKVSVNDLILKALGNALREVPEANATWNGDSIRRYDRVDVGVAIAIQGGLVTPVISGVDERTLTSVSAAVTDLRTRAENKKLKQNELEGGSFSLTNLGMYGVRDFSAIINPPHAGILAVGAGEQRAIVVDGELAVGTMLTCTLSADHRVIDGAVAAQLLSAVKRQLENPARILV